MSKKRKRERERESERARERDRERERGKKKHIRDEESTELTRRKAAICRLFATSDTAVLHGQRLQMQDNLASA